MGKKKEAAGPTAPPKKTGMTMAQVGIIRALKKRGYDQAGTDIPVQMVSDKHKIDITADAAVVQGTGISIPLGKGAINKLMAALPK